MALLGKACCQSRKSNRKARLLQNTRLIHSFCGKPCDSAVASRHCRRMASMYKKLPDCYKYIVLCIERNKCLFNYLTIVLFN